jgi:hypothetical protein
MLRRTFHRVPGWLVVYAAFVLLHVLLTLGTWDIIDQEELEFGTVPMLHLDGEADAIGTNRTIRREGSQVLLAPFFVLIFRLFGTSMAALKFGGLLLTGFWAAGWYQVGRKALPHVPPWLVAAAFILPVPLVQRSAVSAASIHTHLGASMLHALVLLLVLWAAEKKWWWLALSGALAGVGIFFSLTLGPLLFGVLWLVWKAGGVRGLLAWGVAAVPGTMVQLGGLFGGRGTPDTSNVSGLMKGTVVLDPSFLSLSNLANAALYGPGFAAPGWADAQFLSYSPYGVLLVIGCLVALVVGRVRGGATEGRDLRVSLLVAAAVFTPLLLLGDGSVRGDLFDGPRYTLPLLPLLTIGGLYGAGRLGVAIPAAHALGFILLFRPAVFPAPWADVRGAEPWLDRRPQSSEFVLDDAPEHRRARYALWTGMRLAIDNQPLRGPESIRAVFERHGLEGIDADEFWRGTGYSLEVWTDGVDRGVGGQLLATSTPQVQARLWEGAAMAWKCADPGPLQQRAGREFKTATAWGRGRVDLFCRRFGGGPIDDGGLGPAFHDGLRANWALDVADSSSIAATPGFLRDVQIYARFDLREEVAGRRR